MAKNPFGDDPILAKPVEHNDNDARAFMQVADAIRAMKPRELSPSALEDVFLVIEYAQAHIADTHAAVTARSNQLAIQEKELARRERDLELRVRGRNLMDRIRGR
jgi:hypothetical protein